MEEWQRVASEKEEDGLEKKSVDSRNDYGDSNEDSYQQQILEKTRLAFAAHAAQQLTNNNDSNSDTQQILKNPGDNCSAFIATQSKRDGTPKQIKEELEDSANTQDRYLDYLRSAQPPQWVPDHSKQAKACNNCSKRFDWIRRKHHCILRSVHLL
jgi:hypothetical protein